MFPSISCFVPVYNEAHTVRNNIEIIYQNLARLKEPFEIFIVDDASTDTTPQICQKMARKHNDTIRYLHYDLGPSKRENIPRGLFFKNRLFRRRETYRKVCLFSPFFQNWSFRHVFCLGLGSV